MFAKDRGGSDNRGEVKKLTPSEGSDSHLFGHAVAIHEDIVLVGTRWDDAAGDTAGAVYVFARDEGGPDNWGEVVKVTASDAEADGQYGASVAISGDTALIGAPFAGLGLGPAYVLARMMVGWSVRPCVTSAGGRGILRA